MSIIMYLFVDKKVLHCLTFIAFYIIRCYTLNTKYYTLVFRNNRVRQGRAIGYGYQQYHSHK